MESKGKESETRFWLFM